MSSVITIIVLGLRVYSTRHTERNTKIDIEGRLQINLL